MRNVHSQVFLEQNGIDVGFSEIFESKWICKILKWYQPKFQFYNLNPNRMFLQPTFRLLTLFYWIIETLLNMNRQKMTETQQSYFSNLLKRLQQNTQSDFWQTSYPQTADLTEKCIEDAVQQIVFGIIDFKQKSDRVQDIIKVPSHKKIGKDIKDIDAKIRENEQMLKRAKRQLILHKKQQQQAIKLQHEIKMRQNAEKIKSWSQQQHIYNEKRQQLFQKREKLIEEEQQRLKQLKQQQNEETIAQRKKSLEKRLKAMEQERQRRQQIYEQGLEEYRSIKQPLYKEIEKKYEKVVAQEKFQKQIIKKNIKIERQFNHEMLNQHEKNYMQKVKDKGYTSVKTLNSQQKLLQESRFKNLLKRTDEQIEEEREKFKRRLNFQQRISQIPVSIDDAKKIKIEIARDKAKNPLKYNFLRQKQLNDYQIYMQFKDFELDIDRNELGKNYLEEAKKIGQESRIKKSHSVSAISLKQKDKQQRYKDYLPEIRTQRSAHMIESNPTSKKSIQQVFKRESNRQKAIEKISISLKKYDDSIKDRKIQLKTLNTISSTLKKQRQIDQMYMKSLKAKLACLQIN